MGPLNNRPHDHSQEGESLIRESSPRSSRWPLFLFAGVSFAFVLLIVALGSFYIGRFWGFREGVQSASLTLQQFIRDLPQQSNPSSGNPQRSLNLSPSKGSATHKNSPPTLPNLPSADNPLNSLLSPGGDGSLPSLEHLEKVLGGMIPASEGSPPQPSAKALALVRRGKKDDDASVKNYLKEVHSLLETDLSGQALLSGVQGGDSRALEKAHADLGESRTKLQEMEVPPRCVSLHGYYLTLMDEIEQFFVIQKRAQGGEMEGILEGLVTAQKVIAMHKQVEKMEKELLKPQK